MPDDTDAFDKIMQVIIIGGTCRPMARLGVPYYSLRETRRRKYELAPLATPAPTFATLPRDRQSRAVEARELARRSTKKSRACSPEEDWFRAEEEIRRQTAETQVVEARARSIFAARPREVFRKRRPGRRAVFLVF